jgi:predicted dehydrogenase
MRIYLDSGKKFANADAKTIKLPKADQYQLQAEAFARAVQGKEQPEFGVEDAIKQMRVLDALFRSERSGTWETV